MGPKARQTLYLGGTIVTGIIGIALLWGGIDSTTANSVNQIVGGLGVLLGGTSSAVAAAKTGQQRKDGTFDQLSPADAIINALPAVLDAKAQAEADIQRVTEAARDALGQVPVVGPLAEQVIASVTR